MLPLSPAVILWRVIVGNAWAAQMDKIGKTLGNIASCKESRLNEFEVQIINWTGKKDVEWSWFAWEADC